MDYKDFDMSVLQQEFTRVSTSKKPGEKKNNSGLEKYVRMPKEEGYVILRLLPPLPGRDHPYCSCRIHNMGTMGPKGKPNNVYCGRNLTPEGKWWGDCLFCEYYSHLYRLRDQARQEGKEALAKQFEEKAKFIKAQEKYYYNAMVLASDPDSKQNLESGPLIYSCGITLHSMILEACLGNKKMNKKSKGNIFNPVTGRNLQIVKKVKPGGTYPDYSGCEWEDVSRLSDDDTLIQKWLGSMNDVFALKKVLPEDQMKKVIRVFEGKEQDVRKGFDASFLDDDAPVETAPETSHFEETHHEEPAPAVDVPQVDDGADLADDDLAEAVRAAIAGS